MSAANKIIVRIEKMAPEGKGLARWEGRVVFVPYAAPGDTLEITLDKVKESYALGSILRVLEPGSGRADPPCPLHFHVGKNTSHPLPCGGCDWQHICAAEQLASKRAIVEDCLVRIGKLRDVNVLETLASPQNLRYRNKVQVPFGKEGGKIVAGFYAPGTHQIVDFSDCLVQPELSVRIALKVKAMAQELRWPIYDENSGRGWLRHVFVRSNQEGKAMVALITRDPEFAQRKRFARELKEASPEIVGIWHNVQPLKTSVILGPTWRKIWGQDYIEEKLGKLRLRCGPCAFLQVNTPASEILYGVAADFLGSEDFHPELALDLYCGVGAIALWVASLAKRVLGIEENREAIEDAWKNARLNNISNVKFAAGRVETLLGKMRHEMEQAAPRSCAAILDPPRSGCELSVLQQLRHESLRRIIYVSCNPPTLARDAAQLISQGYRLRRVQPVDLFPQTSHVEAVALFER